MASKAAMEQAVRSYLKAWAERDKGAFLALFAQDATIEDPVGSPIHEGHEALSAFWDRVIGLGLEMNGELHRVVSCGEECLAQFTMRSTQNGQGMAVKIVDHFAFDEDGRFRSMRAFWDNDCMSPLP